MQQAPPTAGEIGSSGAGGLPASPRERALARGGTSWEARPGPLRSRRAADRGPGAARRRARRRRFDLGALLCAAASCVGLAAAAGGMGGVASGCAAQQRPERQAMPDPLEGVEGRQLYERGIELARRGDMVRAEQYLVSAMDRGHPDEVVIPQLVRVCAASSRISAALAYAGPYLQQHPGDWRLRYVVATMKLALDRVAEAVEDLELVVAHVPDQPLPHFTLATVLRDGVGDPAAAVPHFERYLQLEPEGEHAEEARASLRPRIWRELGGDSAEAEGAGPPEAQGAQAQAEGRAAPRGAGGQAGAGSAAPSPTVTGSVP